MLMMLWSLKNGRKASIEIIKKKRLFALLCAVCWLLAEGCAKQEKIAAPALEVAEAAANNA